MSAKASLGVLKKIKKSKGASSVVKNPHAMQETPVQFLGWKDLLEKGKTTNSSVLAWRISWAI